MKGYIIENETGDFLAGMLYWYHHEKASDAWVHPIEILTDSKFTIDTKSWRSIPKYAYPAEYIDDTIIIGERFEIYIDTKR